MKNERHVEINSDNYSYNGKMTMEELFYDAEKYSLNADDVVIEGLVMYGWDEIEMTWCDPE